MQRDRKTLTADSKVNLATLNHKFVESLNEFLWETSTTLWKRNIFCMEHVWNTLLCHVTLWEENKALRKGLTSPIVVCPAPFEKGSLATGAWSLIIASSSWLLKPSGIRLRASTSLSLGAFLRWSPFINILKSKVSFSLLFPVEETKSMASFHMQLLSSKWTACVSWPVQ